MKDEAEDGMRQRSGSPRDEGEDGMLKSLETWGDTHRKTGLGGGTVQYMLPAKVVREVKARGKWLLILMLFQSGSSFVLHHFETLVREHLVLTLFLTMLVGAGGNAGAQSAMQTLQQITAEGDAINFNMVLQQQGKVAVWLGALLSGMAWLRVYFFHGGVMNATAIALSCGVIVSTSIVIGACLPFLLLRCRHTCSKVLSKVCCCGNYTRALTCENL